MLQIAFFLAGGVVLKMLITNFVNIYIDWNSSFFTGSSSPNRCPFSTKTVCNFIIHLFFNQTTKIHKELSEQQQNGAKDYQQSGTKPF